MPRFSLVVPTLSRAETLEHALSTLLAQSYRDLEIVVQNNGNDLATRAVVERAEDPRVRHFETHEIVPMVENWERALSNATGDFVTFVGDDDGLLPDACLIADAVFGAEEADILSWQPFLYLWPRYWDERRRNRLQGAVSFRPEVHVESSRPLLERFYAFDVHYSRLPMLYNSFVSRALLERVRERCGRYFLGALPDVGSGIVNAAFTETFLVSNRALSVAGLSQHSTGNRWTRSAARLSAEELARDFSRNAESEPTSNLEWLIAEEMIRLEKKLVAGLHVDRRGLVRAISGAINESPSRYDETKRLVVDLMKRYGIPDEDIVIPARTDHAPAPADGAHSLGPDEVLFVLDGGRFGMRTIADAVGLAAQLVPAPEAISRAAQSAPRGAVPPLSLEPLSFAKGHEGVGSLVSGWGEPESWGTWSVDRSCLMRFQIPASRKPTTRLGLQYRTVPFPDGTPREVRCVVGGKTIHEWLLSDENFRGELAIDVPAAVDASVTELSLVNVNAKSVSELGLGQDHRRLGIGVETIRVLP